jgi:hypothetical protein
VYSLPGHQSSSLGGAGVHQIPLPNPLSSIVEVTEEPSTVYTKRARVLYVGTILKRMRKPLRYKGGYITDFLDSTIPAIGTPEPSSSGSSAPSLLLPTTQSFDGSSPSTEPAAWYTPRVFLKRFSKVISFLSGVPARVLRPLISIPRSTLYPDVIDLSRKEMRHDVEYLLWLFIGMSSTAFQDCCFTIS